MNSVIDHYWAMDRWGLIPQWISSTSEKPLWEQIHDNYAHGGGWTDFNGFEVRINGDDKYELQYPDDPVYVERDRMVIGDETLVIFDHSWVLWTDGNNNKIARID